MSARDVLIKALVDAMQDANWHMTAEEDHEKAAALIAGALAEHAHELAEKQRDVLRQGFRMEPWASVVNSFGETEPLGTTHVIDHIDPEITEVRPARVALAELRAAEVLNSE